jgi:DNA transformation protein
MPRPRHPRTPRRSNRSLASSAAFETFVLDQLADLGDVLARKMFGGVGLYCDGDFFGIIARDVLYLKVDARTRDGYETRGSQAFAPYPDRPGTMQYYAVPLDVLESGPELVRWARNAVAAARRAARGARNARVTE